MLVSSNLFAKQIYCEVKVNQELTYKTHLEVNVNQKYEIGIFKNYKFTIFTKDNSNYEIEAYNPYIPSRTYALGYLEENKGLVSLVIWKRNALVEGNCKAVNE